MSLGLDGLRRANQTGALKREQKNTTAQARNLIICSYYAFPIFYVLGTAMFVYLFLIYNGPVWPFIDSIAYNAFMLMLALALRTGTTDLYRMLR